MSSPTDLIPLDRLHGCLILIVDDVEMNRRILSHTLKASGYGNIAMAADGAQALQLTRGMMPDIVILDLMMPGIDGFAYCEEIRSNEEFDSMPIIVQTALDEVDHKLRAFKLGASDYVCKPIDHAELAARVAVHLTQRLLMQDMRDYRHAIDAELESARHMQNRLMPGAAHMQMCERVFNLKIACHFETSSALGGDCWGMRPLSDSTLALFMYDFSGHGMPAAMNVFRMHTLIQECFHAGGEPGHFLTMLNQRLYPLIERDEFATMFYGIIDTDANCLQYAAASVLSPLLFTRTEKEPLALTGRGFPLGAIANATYDTRLTPFSPGDLLVLFSDGLVETREPEENSVTETKIRETAQEIFSSQTPNPSAATVAALMDLYRHQSGNSANDDITINAYWRVE